MWGVTPKEPPARAAASAPEGNPTIDAPSESAYRPATAPTRSRLGPAFTHAENASDTSSNAGANAKYGMRP